MNEMMEVQFLIFLLDELPLRYGIDCKCLIKLRHTLHLLNLIDTKMLENCLTFPQFAKFAHSVSFALSCSI